MSIYLIHIDTKNADLRTKFVLFFPRLSDAREVAWRSQEQGHQCRIFRLGDEVKTLGAMIPTAVYLDCPFDEKDDAKNLGARWDPELRKWYVPEHLEVKDFQRWLPDFDTEPRKALSAENANITDFEVIDMTDFQGFSGTT